MSCNAGLIEQDIFGKNGQDACYLCYNYFHKRKSAIRRSMMQSKRRARPWV